MLSLMLPSDSDPPFRHSSQVEDMMEQCMVGHTWSHLVTLSHSLLSSTPAQVEDMMEQCKGEVYVHHLWGHYFFLPGIHFFQMGAWHMPHQDVRTLVVTLRHIARLLWTLMLEFEQVGWKLSGKSHSARSQMLI